MLQQQVYILNTILMVLDALCIIAAGYSAFYIKFYFYDGMWQFDTGVFNLSVFLVMMANNYVMGRQGLYNDRRPDSYLGLFWRVLKAILIDFAILAAGVFITGQKTYSRFFLLAFMGLSFGYICLFRAGFRVYLNRAREKGFNLRNILVVGDRERGEMVADLLNQQISMGHRVMGRLVVSVDESDNAGVIGRIEDFDRVLRDATVDEVVFALGGASRSVDLGPHLAVCRKMGIPVRILPAMWDQGGQHMSIETCQKVPFLTLQMDRLNATGLLYKRILDLVGGLIGALILAALYPFVALAIKLDTPGPVIFKQKRMGRNGRVFDLYKFRSMYQDAEARKAELLAANQMDGGMFKMRDDPRVTRVGRWLRCTSLDEFPQFINVFKGEMSLVGTRPPTLDEVKAYDLRHLRRISAKPGITGLWQVSGRSRIQCFDEVVALDCQYLEKWRFSDDLKILLKTVWVVLTGRGAV